MSVPALGFLDRCIFTAVSGGTGSFVVASAVTGYQAPTAAGGVEGKQYGYAAQSADLTQWEYGYGFWSNASQTLTRIVINNSLGTTSPINFVAAPNVLITVLGESLPLTVNVSPIVGGTPGKFLTTDMTGTTLIESDAHFPEATANIDFYVSPAGNDSNPGTITQPFATHNRAMTEAARFNWVFFFKPIIHQADGTYPQIGGSGSVQIGDFVNLFENVTFVGNPANPQNIVMASAFEVFGTDTHVAVGGLSFSGVDSGSCLNIVNGGMTVSDPVIFNDNNQTPFYNEGLGFFFINTTITVNATQLQWFAGAFPGVTWFSHPTIHLPVALTISTAFFDVEGIVGNTGIGGAQIIFGGPTVTNAGGVSGTQLILTSQGVIATQNGALSDIPGTGGLITFGDQSGAINGFNGAFGKPFGSFAGVPTTTQVPVAGTWSVWKDTSGGGMYVVANDGGTLKKVAMT